MTLRAHGAWCQHGTMKALLPLLALMVLSAPAPAQTAADSAAVIRAALDYIEGFYDGDSTKLIRAVHPEVNKYGFGYHAGLQQWTGYGMSFAGFLESAREVREGVERVPPGAPKAVELLDVMDQTAAAKVTAIWGVDYLLLAKFDGRWMIRQVLWQSSRRR